MDGHVSAASKVPGAEWLGNLEPLPNSEPGTMVLRAPAALIRDQAKEKLREPPQHAWYAISIVLLMAHAIAEMGVFIVRTTRHSNSA